MDVAVRLPEVGTPAPEFRLPTADGREIALADYRGVKSLVLWFSKGLF
jgi:peroxiredoxin